MNPSLRRWVIRFAKFLGGVVVLFILMQAVPYGRTHSNPPTIAEPNWTTPHIRELAKRACFNCHSNETVWPWYADLAPFSWVVQFDVEGARHTINFSEWDHHYPMAEYAGARVREGMMPPYKYRVAHPEADLTPEETKELADSLDRMLKPE